MSNPESHEAINGKCANLLKSEEQGFIIRTYLNIYLSSDSCCPWYYRWLVVR